MLSGHHRWPDGRSAGDCLVRCNCHGVRMMTTDEMYQHMAEAHPAVFEGLGLSTEG